MWNSSSKNLNLNKKKPFLKLNLFVALAYCLGLYCLELYCVGLYFLGLYCLGLLSNGLHCLGLHRLLGVYRLGLNLFGLQSFRLPNVVLFLTEMAVQHSPRSTKWPALNPSQHYSSQKLLDHSLYYKKTHNWNFVPLTFLYNFLNSTGSMTLEKVKRAYTVSQIWYSKERDPYYITMKKATYMSDILQNFSQ